MPKPTPTSRRLSAAAFLALAAALFALAACGADEAPPPPPAVASAARDAALVAPTRIGVTRAQVSVDATGQAQVTVPLELPDAGNGLAPQLSLVYSSSVEAAGALGYGWSLAPLSSVRRCPPSQALDGHDGGLTMSAEDRACLDGQRLVAIAGRDLEDGSSYRLERDDGTLARFARRGASDPGTWTVYRAGGEILRFGTDDASRLRHARGEAIEWKVAELRDRSDNVVRFEYAHDADERDVRLSAIRYGGNDAGGVADYRRVDLVYASAGRPVSTYLAGHELVRDARLERVDVFSDGHSLGSYRLSYEATPSGTADLLRGVQRCFADGSCYPATRFDYSAGAPGLAPEVRLGAAYRPDDPDLRTLTLRRLVDADGDGWDDVVSLNRDKIVVQRRTPTGFAEPEEAPSGLPITWSSRQNPALFYDLDADGRVDVLTTVTRTLAGRVEAAQTGIYALLGRAGGGFAPAVQVSSALGVGTEAQRLYLTMADADRDGRPDLFAFTDAGLRVLTWRDGRLVDAGASEIVLPQFGLSQGWRFDRHPREVADVNGDGFPDVVGFGNDAVHVSLGHGFRFDAPAAWTHEMTANAPGAPFGIENHLRQLADMNGDGLPDLVGFHRDGVLVALGTGEGFAPATRWLDDLGTSQGWTSTAQLRTVTDVDGDGFADFVGISASRVRVILGRGIALPPVATLPRTQVVELATASPGLKLWKRHLYPLDFADIDSDGQVDLLAFLPEGLFAARNTSTRVRLTGVTDGYGRASRIGYASGNRTNVYRATAPSVYPLVTLPAVGLLVTSLEEQDGTAPAHRLTYAYADATVHRTGLGYLGFSTWTVRDEAARTERIVHYSRDVARGTAGLPVLEETFAVEGSVRRPLARTETTWESRALDGARSVRRILATRTRTVTLDARGEVLVETVLDADIDAAGNPVHQVTTVTDATGTQSVTTDQTFGAEDPAAWIVGRVTASTVTFRRPELPPVVQRATFAYDARGRLREDVREPGSAFETRRVQDRSDNPFGLVSATTRHFSPSEAAGLPAAQAVSSVRYDARGYLAAAVNPLGHVQRVRERDPVTQAVLASEDPNGLVTRYRYAADGALESVTAPDGTEARVERAFAAGDPDAPVGAVVRTTQHRTGQAPASSYADAGGRVLRRVTPQLGGQLVYQDSTYGFDGQVEAESLPYRRGEPVRWTRFGYDARRELVQVTNADGTVERRARAGLARSHTDALGRTATSIVDGQGLVHEVVDTAGGVVHYEYDAANRLTAVVDPSGNRTEMAYDAVGRRVFVRDPNLGTVATTYNALGLPVTVTDGAGYVRQNRYDLLGRLVESRAHAGLADEEVSRWSYDPAPGLLGQLASASGPAVTRRFGYDSLGRLATTDVDLDGRTYHLAQTYDAVGRLASTTYPSGLTVEQVYDASGAFVEVRDAASGKSYYRVLEVYPWGAPARVRHGNGLVTRLDADPASAALRGVHTGVPGAADIVALAYEHDANGNVTARVDERTGISERFGYDALDRLVSIEGTGAAPVSVRYDALGNILERSDRGPYAYGEACDGVTPGPFAVTSVGARRYCYDARGRAVRAGARTLSYGAGDVPVAIRGPEASLELAYGPDAERVLETERRGAQVKRVRWPVPGFEEIDGPTGLEQRHHLTGGATVIVGPDGTREEYAHTDALGSVVAVTDESGAVRARYAFDAWGQRSASDVIGEASRYGFTGHEELEAVGLVHMGGRVYDPEIGRFVAPDPFVQDPGDSQSLNRYSYVANNPLSATDPTGYFSVRSIGKSIGRALGGLGRGLSNPGASLARAGVRLNRWVQNPQNQRMVASIAISVAAAYVAPLAAAQFQGFAQWAVGAAVSGTGGFASGYVASDGNLEYARRSGLSAMAFYGIGQYYMGKTLELKDMAVKAVAHGIVGGVSAAANGGSFESGFASSFLSEAVSLGDGYDRAAGALEIDAGSAAWSAASSALVSGATSELTGGSFEQGAISGALGALYNRYFHRVLEKDGSVVLELVHQQDGNPDEPCTLKYETVLKAVVIAEDGIVYDPVAGFIMELPIVAVSAMAEGAGGLIDLTGEANAARGMTGAASAAQGTLLRAQLAAEQFAGARFPEAITGYTRHGINQAISRDGVGVSTRAILDTFKNPLNITGQSGGRFMITGRDAVVILNAQGRVVTTWGTSAAGVRLVP